MYLVLVGLHVGNPSWTRLAVDVLPPATRHGVPGTVICSEGYRRLQELDGKRRETTIYTGSARRKVTAPYVQCGVDSILRPALFVVVLRGLSVMSVAPDLGTPAFLYIV